MRFFNFVKLIYNKILLYIGVRLKKKFDYIYDNYGHIIIWVLLAIQAIAVAISTY